jgi:hypothetical protein
MNVTANGSDGGIWMAGQGPAAGDDGDVYMIVGNGDQDADGTPPMLGQCFTRLRLEASGIRVVDWFAPYNWQTLSDQDLDLGSAGPMLIPGTNSILGGGKEGRLYLLDRDDLGHFHEGDDSQILQSFNAVAIHDGLSNHIHGAPVYWDGPTGKHVYLWGENDVLRAFSFDGARFDTSQTKQGGSVLPIGMPGGMLSISANGGEGGSGIVWASHAFVGDASNDIVHGILSAVDASDVTHELWNSELDPRDSVGNFAKFCPPAVADGKVFMATFSNRLDIYGLKPK